MSSLGRIAQDNRAQKIIDRWHELKSERSRFEADWEDIARLIRPQRGGFGMTNPGDRTYDKPLSSEPIMAQSSMAAGIYAAITNPANQWGGFETGDEDLNRWQPMAEWNDIVTRRVMASFQPSVSSFYSATFQSYSDIAAFGQGPAYDEIDEANRRFIDVAMSLAEVVVVIDAHNRVAEIIRKFHLTPAAARAAFRKAGDELPGKMIELEEKGSTEKFAFYTHVYRNWDFVRARRGKGGPTKPWASLTATECESWVVREKGYDDMPFYFPRWDVDAGQTYATGQGFIALPASRVLHQMEAATIRAAQRAADPPILAPDRDTWAINGRVAPGRMIYGAVDVQGRALVQPMPMTSSTGLTQEEKRAKVEEIAKCFHYALMPLSGRTGMTTEETRIVEEANLRNWAPHADRVMEEYAALKMMRRFRLLWRAGQIPPPPHEAQGVPMNVKYQSAAAMALRAREGLAVRQFLADLGPLANLSPRHAQRIAARLDPDAAMEALHDASPSLPARLLRDTGEAAKIEQADQQQAQAAQAMAMLKEGGGGLKDLAQAGAALGGQGAGQ